MPVRTASPREKAAVASIVEELSFDTTTRYPVHELLERFGVDAQSRTWRAKLDRILALLSRAQVNINTSYGDPILLSSAVPGRKATRARQRLVPTGPDWRDASPKRRATRLEPGQTYRVLSVQPPWAWAIIFAGKDVENRSWSTNHRGPLLIHASSRQFGGDALAEARHYIADASGLPLSRVPVTFPRSTLLGLVDLVDCVEDADSPWADYETNWILRRPRPLAEPIEGVHGRLNLWSWTATAN